MTRIIVNSYDLMTPYDLWCHRLRAQTFGVNMDLYTYYHDHTPNKIFRAKILTELGQFRTFFCIFFVFTVYFLQSPHILYCIWYDSCRFWYYIVYISPNKMQLFQLVGEYINQKLKKILIKSKTYPPYGFHLFYMPNIWRNIWFLIKLNKIN